METSGYMKRLAYPIESYSMMVSSTEAFASRYSL